MKRKKKIKNSKEKECNIQRRRYTNFLNQCWGKYPSSETAEAENKSRPRSKPQAKWNNLGTENVFRILWGFTKITRLSNELRRQLWRLYFGQSCSRFWVSEPKKKQRRIPTQTCSIQYKWKEKCFHNLQWTLSLFSLHNRNELSLFKEDSWASQVAPVVRNLPANAGD